MWVVKEHLTVIVSFTDNAGCITLLTVIVSFTDDSINMRLTFWVVAQTSTKMKRMR